MLFPSFWLVFSQNTGLAAFLVLNFSLSPKHWFRSSYCLTFFQNTGFQAFLVFHFSNTGLQAIWDLNFCLSPKHWFTRNFCFSIFQKHYFSSIFCLSNFQNTGLQAFSECKKGKKKKKNPCFSGNFRIFPEIYPFSL